MSSAAKGFWGASFTIEEFLVRIPSFWQALRRLLKGVGPELLILAWLLTLFFWYTDLMVRIVTRERRVVELARIVLAEARIRVFFFLTFALLDTGAIGG